MFFIVKESALILLQTVPKEIKIKQLKRDIVKKVIRSNFFFIFTIPIIRKSEFENVSIENLGEFYICDSFWKFEDRWNTIYLF
jgi:hypothetical protein